MNRRDFLRALGLGASACALSPLLDLAPISAAPSTVFDLAAFYRHLKEAFDDLNRRFPIPQSPAYTYTRVMFENIAVNADGTLRKST